LRRLCDKIYALSLQVTLYIFWFPQGYKQPTVCNTSSLQPVVITIPMFTVMYRFLMNVNVSTYACHFFDVVSFLTLKVWKRFKRFLYKQVTKRNRISNQLAQKVAYLRGESKTTDYILRTTWKTSECTFGFCNMGTYLVQMYANSIHPIRCEFLISTKWLALLRLRAKNLMSMDCCN